MKRPTIKAIIHLGTFCIGILIFLYTLSHAAEIVYHDDDSCLIMERRCQTWNVDADTTRYYGLEVFCSKMIHDTTTYYAKREPMVKLIVDSVFVYRPPDIRSNRCYYHYDTIPQPIHFSVDTVIECWKEDAAVVEYSGTGSWITHYDCYLPDTLYDTTWVFPVEE